MGGNTQYRLALNSMVWAAFTWSFVSDKDGSFGLAKSYHWLNYALDTSNSNDATKKYGPGRAKVRDDFHAYKEYSYERACGFYNFIQPNNESAGRNDIISLHYINESLDELWKRIDCNGSPSRRDKAFKSIYASEAETINYENQMKLVFDAVSAGYNARKAKLQEVVSGVNNSHFLLHSHYSFYLE